MRTIEQAVRIFLQEYLHAVTQNFLTRGISIFKFPKKCLDISYRDLIFLHQLLFSFVNPLIISNTSLIMIGNFFILCSARYSISLSDPMTPFGDYKTWNFSGEDFIKMNEFLMMITRITILTFWQAFDSQCNNKDIFQEDSRGKQSAKEVLSM